VTSSLFSNDRGVVEVKSFGERYNGRYHLPLLPGESGTKAGGDYVPRGVMSATNLAGSLVDSRALSIWERERGQIGLAMRPELFERLVFAVNMSIDAGVDMAALKDSPRGKDLVGILAELHDQAKTASGGNRAAAMGTNRHNAWEERGRSGALIGTPQINAEILALEALLEENGLERVPGLSERVVRNVALGAAGRFDDILMSRRTGRLYLADLKTKRRAFYSWLETWIQLSVYATAEWMLDFEDMFVPYIPGPVHHVDQKAAVLLRMPSDGGAPYLQRVDLEIGRRWAQLARDVTDARAEAKSTRANELAIWREEA
jgi:hypothetical protein